MNTNFLNDENERKERKADDERDAVTAFRRSSLLSRSPPAGRTPSLVAGPGGELKGAKNSPVAGIGTPLGGSREGAALCGANARSGTVVIAPKSSCTGASAPNTSGQNAIDGGRSALNGSAFGKQNQQVTVHADTRSGTPVVGSVAVEGSPRLALIRKMREMEEDAISQCKMALDKMQSAMNRQKNISNEVKIGAAKISELLDVMANYRRTWKKAEEEKMVSEERKRASQQVANADTPKSARDKRPASSPIESGDCKKVRSKDPGTKVDEAQKEGGKWQTVTKEAKRRKPKNKPVGSEDTVKTGKARPKHAKPEAILIRPTGGKSYSEVLKGLRNEIKADETSAIRTIRKTATGAILLEFGKGEKVRPDFLQKLKSTVKETADIRGLKPTASIEIRDLDSLTTREEVEAAVRRLLSNEEEQLHTKITAPNLREQVRAFVTLSVESAAKLIEIGNVRIGCIRAKMRMCENIKRCYRCLGVGHTQSNCSGPDRTNVCIRCGVSGHKMKDCKAVPKCIHCADNKREKTDHLPGSKRCPLTKL